MKKPFLASLLLCLVACSSQPSQELVSEYVKAHADNPNSYESVSFGPASRFRNADILGASNPDTTTTGTRLSHTYKIKTGSGATVEKTHDFVVLTGSRKVMQIPDSTTDVE